jgi:hypothetical protein
MTAVRTRADPRRAPRRYKLALAAVVVLVLVAIGIVLIVQSDVHHGSSGSKGVQGSGVAATESRSLAAFTGVELAGVTNVTIRVGRKQSVVVHADDNLLRRVTTRVRGGSLVIGNTSGSFTAKSPMRVEVSVPSLEELTLSGSGAVTVAGVEAPRLTVTLAGSGVVRASGTAARLDVSLSGSGEARLHRLVARDVNAVVSGAGQILVTATKRLNASVPGTGSISYGGNPSHVTTSITGSGAVTRG